MIQRTASLPAFTLALAMACALQACKPAVNVENPSPFEEDDPAALSGSDKASLDHTEPAPDEPPGLPGDSLARPALAAGRGVRQMTIGRTALHTTLDRGPGMFLRGVEIRPRLQGERFEGWEIVQFMPGETRFDELDLRPGDVIGPINGHHVPRPEHLQALWSELRTASAIVVEVRRGGQTFELRFEVSDEAKSALP